MKDFEILFKEGRFVGGSFVTIKYWKVQPEKYPKRRYDQGELKIGFVAGLKVSKSAVKRNRIKRQMREVVRLLIKDEKIKKGSHILVIAKKEILTADYEKIQKDILSVFRRAGLLL